MSKEIVCANGHVIDQGQETCSRCSAGPVQTEAVADNAVDDGSKDQNTMSDENEKVAAEGEEAATPASDSAEQSSDSSSSDEAKSESSEDSEEKTSEESAV